MAHLIHGLVVESSVSLAAATAPAGRAPDLVLRLSFGPLPDVTAGTTVADCRDPGPGYRLARDGGAWSLEFPRIAVATWRDTEASVRLRVHPSAPVDLVPVLVGGPLLASLALSRGHQLLHASSVTWPGAGAVALAGPRGSGKSTIARLLAAGGGRLLSDDALRVDVDAEVVVHRGTTLSRLRSPVTLTADEGRSTSADGRLIVASGGYAPDCTRLAVVLVPLLSRAFTRCAMRDLPGRIALTQVAGSWPVDGLVDGEMVARRLAWASRLLAHVPVRGLEVPWSGGAVGAELESLLSLVEGAVRDDSQTRATR